MFLISILCCYWILQFSVHGYMVDTRVIHIDANGTDTKECCQLGYCPCSSLDAAFDFIDPGVNNITIEIDSDINLNATHNVSDLNIFLLTGYFTVTCSMYGGVEFRLINTLKLKFFVWKGCAGSPGAVSVYNSSLVVTETNFKDCTTRALAIFHCSVLFDAVVFGNNKGAMYVSNSNLTFINASIFAENIASVGGAIYFANHSHVKLVTATVNFYSNKADTLGGAIYAEEKSSCDVQPQLLIESDFNSTMVFSNNLAVITGNSWYFEVNTSCNFVRNASNPDSLVYHPSKYLYDRSLDKEISSSLYQLKLSYPAKCININSNGICTEYELNDVMPGQEIKIPAKMLGYYGYVGMATEVMVNCSSNCDNIMLDGDNVVLVYSETALSGVRIRARYEVAANITLQLTTITKTMSIVVYLSVKISQCAPGYRFVKNDQPFGGCICYDYKDIINCLNDSTAQIKQGYWIGKVKESYTTTTCPTQYCDFSSCNDCVGYCLLPHNHDGQCKHHKTGPACGSCKPGYVLPFDSVDCVESSKCSAGITVLLVMLIIIYWFVTVAVIIVLMNFHHFQVGYAYGIIYFYSVIDVLVDDTSDWSVFQVTTILSGFAKMSPKFLGSLCFVGNKEWSGLDQQIIRYIHPIAVILILLVLSRAARCPIRLSQHIRRSIIRSICLILLLAYTSVASSSLELLRPLTFANVDGIYVYCSPNIGYFNGRHIAYGVIAILGSLLFVIGLPLLLLLEPLCLNRYLNLLRIKPLLDHYQACYKHKYRYFASYYLFCRVAILIVIYTETNHFNRSFILQVLCIVIAIIHGSVLPYKETFANVLDLIILLITVFAVNFNTGYSFTAFHSSQSFDVLLLGIVITPLICFLIFVILKNWMSCSKPCRKRDDVYYEPINDEDGYFDMRYSSIKSCIPCVIMWTNKLRAQNVTDTMCYHLSLWV